MKKINKIIIFVIILFSLIQIALAVPNSINIQGKLTDSSDKVKTGTFNFSFGIYDNFTSGNKLYETNITATSDSRGIYDVILKNVNISFDKQLYLGVEVNKDGEMTPRGNLTAVPYSFRANTSESLDKNKSYTVSGLNVTQSLIVGGGANISGDLSVNNEINLTSIGNIDASGNLSISEKIIFTLGEIIDNLVNGFLTITGGLNVTESLIVKGGANVSGDLGVSGNIYGEIPDAFKNANFTTRYDLRADRFDRENVTDYLGGSGANASLLRVGNVSDILGDAFKLGNLTDYFGDSGFNGSVLRVGNISNIRESSWNWNDNASKVLDNGTVLRTLNLSDISLYVNETSNASLYLLIVDVADTSDLDIANTSMLDNGTIIRTGNLSLIFLERNSSLWNNSGTDVVLRDIDANVGIGTSSPSQKLHVEGNIYASGAVDLGGKSNSTSPANRLTIFSGGEQKLKLLNTGTLQLGTVPPMSNSAYQLTDYALNVYGTSNFNGALALGATSTYFSYLASDGTVSTFQKTSDTNGTFTADLADGDQFGSSVASIGDLNGDGIGDIAVGARLDDDGGEAAGAIYILFMNTTGNVSTFQKISNTAGSFTATLDGSDFFGQSVASIGDLNGDGIGDIAVGAFQDDDGGTNRGAVYILFMNTTGNVSTFQKISDTNGTFTATLNDSDQFGRSVTSIGDLNGDGIGDLAVGARRDDDGGTDRGAVYILFMNTDGTVSSDQKISDTNGTFTADLADSDDFGQSVASIGDLNGDGIGDIAVGARLDDDGGTPPNADRGAVYILFMNTDGTVSSHQKISDTAGTFTADLANSDQFGSSVTSIGDLNGDGIGDIAVGAFQDDDGGGDRGAVYILFMNTDGTVSTFQKISDTNGTFTATLANSDGFGESLTSIGDLNGDGIGDLAVGAFQDDDGASDNGAIYILFMSDTSRIRLATQSTERLTITKAGNVGIGKTSPNFKLDVAGSINASGLNITGNALIIGNVNITGRLDVGTLNISGVAFSQGDLDVDKSLRVNGGANISGDLGVSGNIYGEIPDAFKLGNLTDYFGDSSFNDSVLRVSNISNIRESSWNWDNDSLVLDNGTIIRTGNLSLIFLERNSSLWNNSGSDVVLNDINANVGIGTTSPNDALEVVGNIRVSGSLNATAINASSIKVGTNDVQTINAIWNYADNDSLVLDNGTIIRTGNLSLIFLERNSSLWNNSGNDVILNDINANVGIGKTSPNFKLDVDGTINASGLLLTNGSFSISEGGSIGIGINEPTEALVVVGNASFNKTTGVSSILIDTTNDAILFTGENGSLYQPVYGTDDGLVLYLPFSRGSNITNSNESVYDRSPYGNDGQCYGTNEADGCNWTSGKYGNALFFDGSNDYVDTGLTNPVGSVSYEAWVKLNDENSNIRYIQGVQNSGNAGGRLLRMVTGATNRVQFSVINESGNIGIFDANFDGLSKDEWHHIVGTLDTSSDTVNIYVDGELKDSTSVRGPFTTQLSNHMVGRRPDSSANFFNGTIDEVRIYKRALAPEEIRTHYLRGSGFGASGAITADKFRVVNTSGNINFIVDNTGNVGIGTSTPSQKLTVVGDLNVTGTSYLGDITVNADNITVNGIISKDGNISFYNSSGSELVRITNEGKVGIGTTSPEANLEIGQSTPTLKANISIGAFPKGIAVAGHYAYVIDQTSNDLKIIDVTDPTAPSTVGTLSIGDDPVHLAIAGRYAYVIDSASNDLKVIDISNPSSPSTVGTLTIGGNPIFIAIAGRYAYVIDSGSNDLKVIDVSDSTAPATVGTLTIGASPTSIAIAGRYAYVVDFTDNDLKVIDVSDSTAPATVGTLSSIGTDPQFITVSGRYAYVIDSGADDLKVFDISNSTAPATVGNLSLGTFPYKMAMAGRYLYVIDQTTSNTNGNLEIIDISNSTAPATVGNFSLGNLPEFIAFAGRYAYVVDVSTNDLKIIDISGIETPTARIGSLEAGTLSVTQSARIDNALDVGSSLTVGIGGIKTDGSLSVGGNSSSYIGGSLGIGINEPTEALVVVGNASFNKSTGGSSILIDTTNDAILFTGENGSLYQPVYGTDDDLVLYLPFNGPNGTTQYDRSPYGNDGTQSGATCNSTNGKYGSGCTFDGTDDYINVGASNSIGNLVNDLTVETWIKLGDTSEIQRIASSSRESTDNGIGFGTNSAGLRFTTFGVKDYDSSTITLSADRWYHVAAVMDTSNDVTFYVDGVNRETVTHTASGSVNTDDDFFIGASSTTGSPSQPFNGSIDEVKIYSRALTEEEIRTHYLRGSGFGASGAITADKFRIVNTSGSRILELNQTSFDVKNVSGDSALYVDKVNSRVGIGITSPTKALHVIGDVNISGRLDIGTLNISGVTFSQGDLVVDNSLIVNGGANISGDLGVSGRVGVGTQTPQDNLEVVGNVRVSGSLNASSINTTGNAYFAVNSGNVGIGTTSPSDKLEIDSGNITIGGHKFGERAEATSDLITSAIRNYIVSIDSDNDDTTASFIVIKDGSSSNEVNNNELFRVLENGNVGIGTTTPQDALEVVGNVRISGSLNATNLNTTGQTILASSSGNVGIGKTSPNFKLDVDGTINASGLLLTNGTFSVSEGGSIGVGTSEPTEALTVLGNVSINDTDGTNRVFVDVSTGNVGIGDTTPQNSLSIAGTADLTGALLITDKKWIGISDKSGRIDFNRNRNGNDTAVSPVISILDANLGVRNPHAIYSLDVAGDIRTGRDILQTTGGTFAAKADYTTGSAPFSVAIGDLNNDGYADLAVANLNTADVSVFINDGDGTFAGAVNYTTGASPQSVAMGDLNNDGYADLAVANNGANNVSVFINDGDGTFAGAVNYTTGTTPRFVAIGDVNNDGYADLVSANAGSATVSVFINDGKNGTFAAKVDYTTGNTPDSVAIGDVNNDGYADLAVSNQVSNTVSVFVNDGDGTFATKVDYATEGTDAFSVAMGDVDNDGYADLAVVSQASDTVSVFVNDGDGTFASKVDYTTGSNPDAVAMGDVDNDGYADLAVTHFTSSFVSIFINDGDGTFAGAVNYTTGTNSHIVDIGDVNNDGYADLAVVNQASDTVSIFINQDSTIFIVDKSTNRVGIGTASPTTTLEVNGNTTIVGDLNVTGTSYLGDVTLTSDNITVNGIVSRDGNITFFNDSGNELMKITSLGKVGIGTATPNATLTIAAGGTTIADEWTVRSDRSKKENIKEFDQNVLDDELKIYTYNFKNSATKRLGLILDEVPDYLKGADGQGIDLYKLAVYTLKQTQELKAENDAITRGVNPLDQKVIDDLNARIAISEAENAEIPANNTEVQITFKQEYENVPIVTITPIGLPDFFYGVDEITTTGFKILISEPQNKEVVFNWHAFGQTSLVVNETKKDKGIIEINRTKINESENIVNETIVVPENETIIINDTKTINNETLINETPVNETLDKINDTNVTIQPIEINATEPIDEEIITNTITGNLEYQSGTSYDTDDDGIETTSGVIDLTVNSTKFNWEVNESNLCTRWNIYNLDNEESSNICYGSGECCNFVETPSTRDSWKEPLYLTYDYGLNNTISSQVIYADYSLNIENPYSNIYYGDWKNLSAVFYERIVKIPIPENKTTGINKSKNNLGKVPITGKAVLETQIDSWLNPAIDWFKGFFN